MGQTVFDGIDRRQTGRYLFKLSLLGFAVTGLGLLAFVIKLKAFTGSENSGYVLFIIRNLLLSLILSGASWIMRKNNTRFAVSFDRAEGWVKLSWLVGFVVMASLIYELPIYLIQ